MNRTRSLYDFEWLCLLTLDKTLTWGKPNRNIEDATSNTADMNVEGSLTDRWQSMQWCSVWGVIVVDSLLW